MEVPTPVVGITRILCGPVAASRLADTRITVRRGKKRKSFPAVEVNSPAPAENSEVNIPSPAENSVKIADNVNNSAQTGETVEETTDQTQPPAEVSELTYKN